MVAGGLKVPWRDPVETGWEVDGKKRVVELDIHDREGPTCGKKWNW